MFRSKFTCEIHTCEELSFSYPYKEICQLSWQHEQISQIEVEKIQFEILWYFLLHELRENIQCWNNKWCHHELHIWMNLRYWGWNLFSKKDLFCVVAIWISKSARNFSKQRQIQEKGSSSWNGGGASIYSKIS